MFHHNGDSLFVTPIAILEIKSLLSSSSAANRKSYTFTVLQSFINILEATIQCSQHRQKWLEKNALWWETVVSSLQQLINVVRSPPILGNWWEIKELANPMCLSVNLHPSLIKLLCSNLSVLRRNLAHTWSVLKIFVLLMGLSIAVRSTVSLSFTLSCSSGSV